MSEPLIRTVVPVLTYSEQNESQHWRARQRRHKPQKLGTLQHMKAHYPDRPTPPLVVTLVRLHPWANSPKHQLDDDNLRTSLKYPRDGVAAWLGIDDGDPRVRYEYGQRKGAPKQRAVEVTVEALEAVP